MRVSSSSSYTRLLLRTDNPEEPWRSDDRALLESRVHEFRFQELTPESENELSQGWVSSTDPLDTAPRGMDIQKGEYLCLGMRVDKWVLPTKLIKARCDARERELLEEREKGKLFRSEKVAIKEVIVREVRRHSTPKMDVIPVVISPLRGEVYVFSKSKNAMELAESLLEATFGCRCVPMTPQSRAAEAGHAIHRSSCFQDESASLHATTFYSVNP